MGDQYSKQGEMKKSGKESSTVASAFRYAWQGVVFSLRTQRNMRIHVLIALVALAMGFLFKIDLASWLAIVVCIGMVCAAECLNTAVEAVVDLVSPDFHELAKTAKDCAAGAVLILAGCSVVVACIVFLPALLGCWI